MNKIKLGDILAIQHGFAFKSQNYVDDSNYALVTLANISSTNNFQYNKANMTFYGADFPKEYILKENDLIMPLTEQSVGLFGNTAFIPFTNNITFVLNQRVGKVIPKEEKTTKYYLHYLLSCEYVKKQLEYRASGTRQRNISPKDIYDVEVFIPEYNIQKKIGSLLYNIEQKININNKISDELEDMAKTIYDYWFLQFEFPNEEGKPYKSSGGKMVWNEELKREIPEGWSYEYISNISKIIAGGDKDENIQVNCDKDHTIPVYSNSEKNKGLYGFTQKATLEEPCITVSARGTIGLSFIRLEPFVPIIRLICVIPNNIEYLKFLEISLNKIDYRKNGSIQQQLTVPQLASYKFIFPNKIILEKYHKITMNIQKKILENEKENQELISLRDFLLPLLMNGQVGFKEDKAEG